MPLKVVLQVAKLTWSGLRFAYAFYDEARREKRRENEVLAKGRSEMSKRYSDASKKAGH